MSDCAVLGIFALLGLYSDGCLTRSLSTSDCTLRRAGYVHRLSWLRASPLPLTLILYHRLWEKSSGNFAQSFNQLFVQSAQSLLKRAAAGGRGTATRLPLAVAQEEGICKGLVIFSLKGEGESRTHSGGTISHEPVATIRRIEVARHIKLVIKGKRSAVTPWISLIGRVCRSASLPLTLILYHTQRQKSMNIL